MPTQPDFAERIVDERLVFAGDTVRVYELRIETQPSTVETFEIVEKAGDSVAILPIDAAGNVHIIREYYPAANARLYSLPKGTVENGEQPEEAAVREMQEEVGLVGDLTPLAVFDLSPGYLRQRTFAFVARNLREARVRGDERTFLERVTLPFDEALKMARSGEISEARLVAALYLARPYLDQDGE